MTVLEKKREVTRFQILVEVAASQPQIKQSQIADSLGITPQAVSEYIKDLVAEGMISSSGRGQYTVTPLGVESISSGARELKDYSEYVLNSVIGQVTVWAAIAREPIKKDDNVCLTMETGILYAGHESGSACGKAVNAAEPGEDVGVSGLKGLIPLRQEKVTVIRIPAIANGGSHKVSAASLKRSVSGMVCASGIEALAALHKAGIQPGAMFGAVEAAVEAATKGVKATLVVSEDMAPQAIQRLEAAGVGYEMADSGVTG